MDSLAKVTELGPKKYRKIARIYDRTGSEHEIYPYKNRPFPTFRPEFRPFVDALNWASTKMAGTNKAGTKLANIKYS